MQYKYMPDLNSETHYGGIIRHQGSKKPYPSKISLTLTVSLGNYQNISRAAGNFLYC